MSRRNLVLLTIVLVAFVACGDGHERSPHVATTASSPPATQPTSAAGRSTAPASTVHVTFVGTNTFVTAPGKDLRVAMINGDSTAPHDPLLILPDDVEPPQGQTVKQYLETVTGGTVRCRTGRCEVKITKPIAVRIVDEGGNGLMPKPVVRELTYDLLVPSLTGLDPTFIDLNDDFAKQVPSGTDIIAFFDVNGGTLSAAPYCGYMGIEQSDGSYKYEKWASHVFLVARTEAKPAKVQIDSGSGWQDVVFADSRVIDIRVENQPVVPRHTHFEMHWKASKGNTGNAPGFKYDRACDQQAGTTVGCGASDWP